MRRASKRFAAIQKRAAIDEGVSEDDFRQRMFELFEEAARIAERINDPGLATVALGAALIAARPGPKRQR